MSDQQSNNQVMEFTRWLIDQSGLQEIRPKRLKELAAGGMIGLACADGKFHVALTNGCCEYTLDQHLLKLNGLGFEYGLDAKDARFDEKTRQYLEALHLVTGWELQESFRELKKGTTILTIAHGPHCGKAHKFQISYQEMLLFTMRADEKITALLKLDEQFVLPALLFDWTPEIACPSEKKTKLYVIKNSTQELIKKWNKMHS